MLNVVISQSDVQIVSSGYLIFMVVFSIAITLLFYLFRSFGVKEIAKKAGLKKLYLAFIPFAWIYLLASIFKKVFLFGKKINNFALLMVFVFTFAEIVSIVTTCLEYIPIVGYYLQGGDVLLNLSDVKISASAYVQYPLNTAFYTKNMINVGYVYGDGILVALKVLDVISSLLGLANILLLFVTYSGVFKKYSPNHFLAATIFSLLGLFPIIIFAVRNRMPIDYDAYVQDKYRKYYENQNGFNQQTQERPQEPEEPFGESLNTDGNKSNENSNQSEQPFDDFFKDNK